MLLFVVLAEVLGAEIILGAFIAGAMLSLLSTREDMEATHQLEAVGFGFLHSHIFHNGGSKFQSGSADRINRCIVTAALPGVGRIPG